MTAAEISRAEALYALALSPFVLAVAVLVTAAIAYVAGIERARRDGYRLSDDTEARRADMRRRAWGEQ